ncbi:MAG: MFS transporter [Thaumarchaeota archaeon]|nr:MFS transporter [Nitrososphaerota archaeon]
MPALPRRTVTLVLAGLLTGLLLGFMDVTIVATAGPTIIADLGGLSLYAWVFSSFIITQTVVIPIFGKLSDLYGRKRFFLLGIVVFMVGSVLSGASQNIYELIIFRAIQGIGFGTFVPATIAIAGDLFPPAKRGRVQGLLFSVNGIAFAVAPAAGSYLTEAINWRWIFYINLPLGVVSFLIIYLALRESRNTGANGFSDWAGASALVGSITLFMLGLFLGGSTFDWLSWEEAALFVGSIVVILAFIRVEGRAREPVLPLRLFKTRTISAATGVNILRAMVLFGLIAYLPLYAQAVLGADVSGVRNAVYAMALPLTAGILLSGATMSRTGARNIILLGAGVLVAGLVALQSLNSSSSLIQLMELEVPIGFASGLMIPPTIVAFQNSVQRTEIGVASALAAFTLNLGAAIGVATLGAIQTNVFANKLSSLLVGLPAAARATLGDPNLVGQILASPAALARIVGANPSFAGLIPMLREAFSQSILILLIVLLGASVAVVAAALFIRGDRKKAPAP